MIIIDDKNKTITISYSWIQCTMNVISFSFSVKRVIPRTNGNTKEIRVSFTKSGSGWDPCYSHIDPCDKAEVIVSNHLKESIAFLQAEFKKTDMVSFMITVERCGIKYVLNAQMLMWKKSTYYIGDLSYFLRPSFDDLLLVYRTYVKILTPT